MLFILHHGFTLALTDCFSLELEWQQISVSLQNSSRYSGRSQQRCCLNGLLSSSYFQVLSSLCRTIGDCTKRTNDRLVSLSISGSYFFQSASNVWVLISFLAFFPPFSLWWTDTAKSTIGKFLLFIFFVSQNPREFGASNFLGWILDCAHTICSYGRIQNSCTILSGSPSPPNYYYYYYYYCYYLQLLLSVSYNLSPSLWPRPRVKETNDYMHSIYFWFLLPLLGDIVLVTLTVISTGDVLHSHIHVHAHIYIYIYWIHTDAIIIRRSNKRRRKTSLKIFTSHFICKGSKGLFKVCVWKGAGDRT